MPKFVGRQRELTELNEALERGGSQFILCYGRRQVGKTTLVLRWAEQMGRAQIYWVATRDTPAQLRRSFAQAVWQWAYPGSRATPRFNTWGEVFETAADLIGDQPVIMVLDQFSYGVESDDSLTGHLQGAWDRRFKDREVVLVLIGSHTRLMLDMIGYDAPLYGRVTGELPLDPLDFPFVSDFLPDYSPADRVAAYAVTGGVPAYLERFDTSQSIGENIQRLFMRRRSMFRNEPEVLIGEVLRRETTNFEAVIKAVAAGNQTPQDIGQTIGQQSSWLSPYLSRLEEVGLIERQLPATLSLDRRQTSRMSRYEVADPYLHFHFRFIAPNLRLVEQDLAAPLWQSIARDFDAWVGRTAFRKLCHDWLRLQAEKGSLPLLPVVGSHWDQDIELDIVAVDWERRTMLVAGCAWREEPIGPFAVEDLVKKARAIVPGPEKEWQVHHVLFARAGFSEPAQGIAEEKGVQLVDMEMLDADLREACAEEEAPPAGEGGPESEEPTD